MSTTIITTPSNIWEKKTVSDNDNFTINKTTKRVASYESTYYILENNMKVYLHPNVHFPNHFPELSWYGRNLTIRYGRNLARLIFYGSKSFLKIGIGCGIVSLYMARLVLSVTGVDTNPNSIETTKKNFEANYKHGHFIRSDLFDNLPPNKKYDTIFWNHLWMCGDGDIEQKSTIDSGYKMLERYIRDGGQSLTENGYMLLRTNFYANIRLMRSIAAKFGYSLHIESVGGK